MSALIIYPREVQQYDTAVIAVVANYDTGTLYFEVCDIDTYDRSTAYTRQQKQNRKIGGWGGQEIKRKRGKVMVYNV